MKSKHENFKRNGIPLFGKRYGRYNLLFVYVVICIGLLGLFALKIIFNNGIQLVIRSVVVGLIVGLTLNVGNLLTYTNVLLIASPKLCVLFLHAMESELLLIESNDTYLKFQRTVKEDSCFYVYDMKRNMIWID